MVVGYSWYISGQISGLRRLQTELTDSNRRESLQLLRIQNDLNQLGLAMRDMLDTSGPYPLHAWSAQFERIRADLDDALGQQRGIAVARGALTPERTAEQTEYLTRSVSQFWDAVERMFTTARAGNEDEARTQIRVSLQARQASLSTAVARLLVQNNESEAAVARQVQEIYSRVQRQVYWFLAAILVAIAGTSLYLIRSNRRLFAELGALSNERREIAQKLMATREATLREIARELHDEFGQLLTAMGSMLSRSRKHLPEGSPVREELLEVSEIAQTALDNVRGLSQTLHPSILEELGLESTIDWYLSTFEKQFGIEVSYQRHGDPIIVDEQTGIHVYRVLQEALGNVARHSGAKRASVRLKSSGDTLELEVEDHGAGFPSDRSHRGLGLVAMRERAELLGGRVDFTRPPQGGTLVKLRVPLSGNAAVV